LSSPWNPIWPWPSLPASYPVGTMGPLPGAKWSGREADHSPPSSAEVKNTQHNVELVKHREVLPLP
jgi:hypothetical protein